MKKKLAWFLNKYYLGVCLVITIFVIGFIGTSISMDNPSTAESVGQGLAIFSILFFLLCIELLDKLHKWLIK